MIKKITPVLFAEEVEPCVEFWKRLGFEVTGQVPEGDKIGFVMLQNGSIELMYQSYASADRDVPALSQTVRRGPTFLYTEVSDFDQVTALIEGAEIVIPERNTFYGAREIGVKDPAGHVITFSQFQAAEA